jgi:hypothetical protein
MIREYPMPTVYRKGKDEYRWHVIPKGFTRHDQSLYSWRNYRISADIYDYQKESRNEAR